MDEIKLLFSGDFAPLLTKQQILKLDFSELKLISNDIDCHITNLECPLTDAEKPIEKSGPAIKASPIAIEAVKKAGVNIACLANNHIFDYHEKGINDTISACTANGIDTIGIVNREDGQTSYLVKEIKGKKIGFMNYCEHEFSVRSTGQLGACGFDEIAAFYDIRYLCDMTDYLVVIYHGGNEYYNLPSPALQRIFRFLVDLGVDAVIGHHTHVFSGYEIYNGKPLVYSLGNFFFPYPEEPISWYTGLLCKVCIDDEISIELFCIEQNKNEGQIRLCNEDLINIEINAISTIITSNTLLQEKWDEHVAKHRKDLLKQLLTPSILKKVMLKMGFKVEKLFAMHIIISLYNILRCQAHYRLVIDSFKQVIKK